MIVTTREQYYKQDYVLYNLILQLKHRYLSVRKKSKKKGKRGILARYYMGYSLDMLRDSLKRNNVLRDTSAKIYFDLAQWKDSKGFTPIFSFDKDKRLKQKEEFSKEGGWKDLIFTYDFAIDIDNKNLKKAWKEAKTIKEVLDNYKLPYSIRFSGSKGFHFVIDSKWIKTKVRPVNRAELFGKIVGNIIEDEKLKSVDTSIYDPRRILKVAYSLCNNDGKEYVCLPLSDEQFDKWEYEGMELAKVMKNIKIFKRGLLERDFGLGEKELKDNVNKFIKEYK